MRLPFLAANSTEVYAIREVGGAVHIQQPVLVGARGHIPVVFHNALEPYLLIGNVNAGPAAAGAELPCSVVAVEIVIALEILAVAALHEIAAGKVDRHRGGQGDEVVLHSAHCSVDVAAERNVAQLRVFRSAAAESVPEKDNPVLRDSRKKLLRIALDERLPDVFAERRVDLREFLAGSQ